MTAGPELEWLTFSWAVIAAVATGGAAVATGIWAVVTWLAQRLEARRAHLRRQATLRIHSFLFAAEDLQSRLYGILEHRDLEHPAAFAEETVYLIAQYFGWERSILRRGAYARDRKTGRLVRAIRDAFATETLDPRMRFSRPEQGAIAELMLKRVQGHLGTEFETITFVEFVAATQPVVGRRPFSNGSRQAALAQVVSLREAVDTLNAAISADAVPGAQRLARIQTRLVALLTHLERKERISLFDGVRCIAPEEKHAGVAVTRAVSQPVY
jgi:hypothetical protein